MGCGTSVSDTDEYLQERQSAVPLINFLAIIEQNMSPKCPMCQLWRYSAIAFELLLFLLYIRFHSVISNFWKNKHRGCLNPVVCADPGHFSASITRPPTKHPFLLTHTHTHVALHQLTTCMHSMLPVSFNSFMWLTFQGLTAGISCHGNHRSYDGYSPCEHFSFLFFFSPPPLSLAPTGVLQYGYEWATEVIIQHPSTLRDATYHRAGFPSCGSLPLMCDWTRKHVVYHTFKLCKRRHSVPCSLSQPEFCCSVTHLKASWNNRRS